jgi:hypothetical protein
VSPTVIDLLLGALNDDELLTVCGTSLDDGVTAALRELRPGSRAQKVPASLLREYEQSIGRRNLWRSGDATQPAKASTDGAVPVAASTEESLDAAG